MTKSTITRERLEKIKSWRETYGAENNVMLPAEEAEELARMALAAMNSEPVAYIVHSPHGDTAFRTISASDAEYIKRKGYHSEPLYRHAQPATVFQPVMFIDGDISSEDADKLAKVIREFNEEDERPLAKMARIIRENPHPTNECDMPKAQPAPVVQCPFPCGWDNLNKLAIQDAALVARGLVEGEPTTEAHRQAAISNNDRLLKVISACRTAMLAAAPQPAPVTQQEPIAWLNDAYLARGVVDGEAGSEDAGPGYIPVYREAQPAPVVPEALQSIRSIVADPRRLPRRREWIGGQQYSYVLLEEVEAIVEDACRTAMLQAGDAVRDLSTPVDPQVAEYEQNVMQADNSPVIPDGYVMVPKEPTAEMQSAGASAIRIETTALNKLWTGNAVFRAMLAAAPQEAK